MPLSQKKNSSKTLGSDKKKQQRQRSKDGALDMAKGITAGMQPHNILASTFQGQHDLSRFLGPIMDTDMPSMGQKQQGSAKSRNKKQAANGGKSKKSAKHSSKKSGRGYDDDDCSDGYSSSSSTESCTSSSSSNDCNPCVNPTVDVTKLMEDPAVEITKIPFGFVASQLDITTEDEMPFTLAYACNNQQVVVTTNTGFDLPDVEDALGFSGSEFCIAGSPLILANLPETMSVFEGLYIVANIPYLDLSGYLLYRINWRDDDCGSMEVGEWVNILLGATSGLYNIVSIVESTQEIELEFLDIGYLQCARLTHMTVPGQKYCYFEQVPTEEVTESSESCSESSESCEDSSDW